MSSSTIINTSASEARNLGQHVAVRGGAVAAVLVDQFGVQIGGELVVGHRAFRVDDAAGGYGQHGLHAANTLLIDSLMSSWIGVSPVGTSSGCTSVSQS